VEDYSTGKLAIWHQSGEYNTKIVVVDVLYVPQSIGVTDTLPDQVPNVLPCGPGDWTYRGSELLHQSSVVARGLPNLHIMTKNQGIYIQLTQDGNLRVCIEFYDKVIASGLPVDKPLWGTVETSTKIKSELLSGESQFSWEYYSRGCELTISLQQWYSTFCSPYIHDVTVALCNIIAVHS
jgi:hypothetical protein